MNNENSDSVILCIDSETSTKYVYWLEDSNYSIVFHGTDTGTMSYHQRQINSLTSETVYERDYINVSLEKGKIYGTNILANGKADNSLYEVNNYGRAINSISSNGSSSKVLFASNLFGWFFVIVLLVGIVVIAIDIASLIHIIKMRRKDA